MSAMNNPRVTWKLSRSTGRSVGPTMRFSLVIDHWVGWQWLTPHAGGGLERCPLSLTGRANPGQTTRLVSECEGLRTSVVEGQGCADVPGLSLGLANGCINPGLFAARGRDSSSPPIGRPKRDRNIFEAQNSKHTNHTRPHKSIITTLSCTASKEKARLIGYRRKIVKNYIIKTHGFPVFSPVALVFSDPVCCCLKTKPRQATTRGQVAIVSLRRLPMSTRRVTKTDGSASCFCHPSHSSAKHGAARRRGEWLPEKSSNFSRGRAALRCVQVCALLCDYIHFSKAALNLRAAPRLIPTTQPSSNADHLSSNADHKTMVQYWPIARRKKWKWTEDNVKIDISEVPSYRMSQRHAATTFSVPKSTLGDRLRAIEAGDRTKRKKANKQDHIGGERGRNVTILLCINAAGDIFIPPLFVFPNKQRVNAVLKKYAPLGSIFAAEESGSITAKAFLKWLELFVERNRPTKKDGHSSHLDVILFTKKHFVHMQFEVLTSTPYKDQLEEKKNLAEENMLKAEKRKAERELRRNEEVKKRARKSGLKQRNCKVDRCTVIKWLSTLTSKVLNWRAVLLHETFQAPTLLFPGTITYRMVHIAVKVAVTVPINCSVLWYRCSDIRFTILPHTALSHDERSGFWKAKPEALEDRGGWDLALNSPTTTGQHSTAQRGFTTHAAERLQIVNPSGVKPRRHSGFSGLFPARATGNWPLPAVNQDHRRDLPHTHL
ncbi:hypothetical protein PR048_008346 [Dryococelus australis]|uniref:HTH psq-type domain-containing protein n=1 Tax=Dryococelus australis TaxID=614101 RepID=A0ABQ9HWU8_9NEOP|nr:hypothetical protein PR048_008346 [Dryococelus australis]